MTWKEQMEARAAGKARAKAERERIAGLERAVVEAAEKWRDVPYTDDDTLHEGRLANAVDALRKARAL